MRGELKTINAHGETIDTQYYSWRIVLEHIDIFFAIYCIYAIKPINALMPYTYMIVINATFVCSPVHPVEMMGRIVEIEEEEEIEVVAHVRVEGEETKTGTEKNLRTMKNAALIRKNLLEKMNTLSYLC